MFLWELSSHSLILVNKILLWYDIVEVSQKFYFLYIYECRYEYMCLHIMGFGLHIMMYDCYIITYHISMKKITQTEITKIYL